MTSDTCQNILQTARRLFIRQGYTATSMRQIAEKVGIGKATIYHHFPDKQAILMAMLDQNLNRMSEALAAIQTEMDPRRRIQVAAENIISFLLETADIIQVARREVPEARNQLQKEFLAYIGEFRASLADAVQRGTEQGIFRPVDPAQAARVFMIMIQGTFAMAYLSGDRSQKPDQIAAALLDIYFHGIDAR